MKSFLRILLCIIALQVSAAISDPVVPVQSNQDEVVAKDTSETSSHSRLWNLQGADILSVINEVSLETGKNFVVDPRVNGKISLVSSKPIKANEVYDVFLSVLELLGYSAIPSGNVVKIVPNMESGEYATTLANAKNPGKGAEVVVRIVSLDNVNANQVIPIIRPMLPQWSNVSAYSPGNVIILVGRAANLQRIVNVINRIDQSGATDIALVPLHHASASQVATVLSNMQAANRGNGDSPQVSIAADERSNSILLGGTRAAQSHMRTLIARLDLPMASNEGNTTVVYLRYLQAKTFAPILGRIVTNMLGKSSGSKEEAANPATFTPNNGGGPHNSRATTVTEKPPTNTTNIQAEPSTNSLIITAPPAMMKSINSIIASLDVRPAQVLVEGIIVEIDQTDLNSLGIKWGSKITKDDINSLPIAGFPGLGANVFGIIPSSQFKAVLTALQSKTGVNILSTPSVIVLDNHKAVLEVGEEVPEQTGTYVTSGSKDPGNPFNTIGRKNVTLKLTVNPQINLGTAVRLKIDLKNDSLRNPDDPGLNPLVNKSEIHNSVIISSGDVVVLGGLMSNKVRDQTDQVPILGDIPIIGNLFKHRSRVLEKKNLMVFLKPTIMHNSEDALSLTHVKYDLTRTAQINWPVDLSNPSEQKRQNILPLWKNNVELPKPFERGE